MISHSPRSGTSEGLERGELADPLESHLPRRPDLNGPATAHSSGNPAFGMHVFH